MNAAELALLADPKALLAYTSSIINLILNGEISADVSIETPLAAAQPSEVAPQSAPATEDVKYTEIRRLGSYPVVSDADLTPDEKEAIKRGEFSKVEKGFQDTTENGINDSPIEKSARAAAMRFFNGDVEEVDRYMKWLHENKQHFIDGSKTPIVDGVGYDKGGFKDVQIVDGEAVMGERNGGAKDVNIKFDNPEQATRGVYVTSGGVRVNSDVYDICANPQLSMAIAETEKPVPAPVVASTCPDKHDWRFTIKESGGGIDLDGDSNPEHKIPVLEAPSDMTLEQARAVLEKSEWKELKDGESRRFLLWIDSDCDGHPEKIECVTVTRDGETVKVEVKPLDTKPGPGVKNYDDLGEDRQRKWVSTP